MSHLENNADAYGDSDQYMRSISEQPFSKTPLY